ncbi:Hkr1p SKDI_04G6270 [Saccharomyces kudriavzevii IFO 1802]|uniref:Uncharacterized protein n=2 Tax=Saccharomyces kudriavzevii (strain ATCC MYA-4449 / AS 2.2408 / CBS 8840 / NBRC 1802 / NCYC 2889) TaxID=226230 RepID=A0AA35JEN8_SACK1|nr:uncharacterized protein SKDI_04G6270 [Saccharomyces kudriavzevii IFO 1802]EJT42407.1 HKR1-like protein [Saccharomyces kudriavzevii IFO 1802]CAI4059232.1 hypothetical protein SKDI_04G6270 [Saccharomyces kudriavzevii IFO 1802]
MVLLKIKKFLLLISLVNTIEAYSNDTTYPSLYSRRTDIAPSYSTSAIYNTVSNSDDSALRSSPETTALAGQYSDSGRVSINERKSTDASNEHTTTTATARNSDSMLTMGKLTEMVTPSSSMVPSSVQFYNERSSALQTSNDNSKSGSRSKDATIPFESSNGMKKSTSDGTAVPRGITSTTTTTPSLSKDESRPPETSGVINIASTVHVASKVLQLFSATPITTTDGSNHEATGNHLISTKLSTASIEEYTIDESDFSDYYGSSVNDYFAQELIVDLSSTPFTTKASSVTSQNPDVEYSKLATDLRVSSTSFAETASSKTVSSSYTHLSSTYASSPVLISSIYTSSPYGSALSPTTPALISSTYTSSPSSPALISSTHTSSPYGFASSPSSPALISSTYTSSPYGPVSSPSRPGLMSSTYTSSKYGFASSPSSPALISSTYTSSPYGPVSSPSSPALISFTHTSSSHGFASSPSSPALISSIHTSSPYVFASSITTPALSPSAYTSSPHVSAPSSTAPVIASSAYTSSLYGLAPEFSSKQFLSTSDGVTPVISVHIMSSGPTNSLQQNSMETQKSHPTSTGSSLNSDAYSNTITVISIRFSSSNPAGTSAPISSTKINPSYADEPVESNTPQRQLLTSARTSYDVESQNIESSSTFTIKSNFPYVSSTETPDNEDISITHEKTTTVSSNVHVYSLSDLRSRHSITEVSSDIFDSSRSSGSYSTSFGNSFSTISSIKYSKETELPSISISITEERLSSLKKTSQPNNLSEKSTTKRTLSSSQGTHTLSIPSGSMNSKVSSTDSFDKTSKMIIYSRLETPSLITERTHYISLSKSSESKSGPSTRASLGSVVTALQTQTITGSDSVIPVSFTHPTTPYTYSNDYAWLPTTIIVEPSQTGSSTAPFNPSITGSLPSLIEPAVAVSEPANHTLITVGFTAGLNYEFLVQNPLSSAQIFNFLPLVLGYPFSNTRLEVQSSTQGLSSFVLSYQSGTSTTTLSPKSVSSLSIVKKKKKGEKRNATASTADLYLPSIETSSIVVKQIVPMVNSSKAYVIAVAEVYFPTEAISYLQKLILDASSPIYNNPQTPLRTLAGLIDSRIPLGGLTVYGAEDGSYISGLSSSVADSSKENPAGKVGTSKYGALDDFINSLTDYSPAGCYALRIIVILIILTAAVLLWLLLVFLAFRYRNELLRRRPRNCIEKSFGNESKLQNVAISRSSSDNQTYNEKTSKTENKSIHSIVGDHYIVTGENTIYSTTHGLHYTMNDDGDLFYREAVPNDLNQLNGGEDLEIDVIVRECVYDKDQDTTEAYLNDGESVSSILDVDENGNIRLHDSYSDDGESNRYHLQDEVIDDYNNSHLYKIQLHGLGTRSCTTDDPDTVNLVTNVFSSGSQTFLPSTAYTTPLHTNSIKFHTLHHAESSLQEPNQAFFSAAEELKIDDIDDNGSVSDVQVEELDALDEELYKRMSKVVKQQNQ